MPIRSLEEVREVHRARLPRWYSGPVHLLITLLAAGTCAGLALTRVDAPTPAEWLAVPATLAFANLFEWWVHRTIMHRRVRGLGYAYDRHTLMHHRVFPHEAMRVASSRDWGLVLFPPHLLVLLMVATTAPIAALLAAAVTPNVAWLYVACVMLNFVVYELLHLAYHLPEDGLVGRLPGMGALRRLHTAHHDPRRMGRYNFNVTVPLGDWLFGTLYRGPPTGP